jgi:hypothetical protein
MRNEHEWTQERVSVSIYVDRPGRAAARPKTQDVTVIDAFIIEAQPGQGETVIVVVIANPSPAPVQVGLSVHRAILPGRRDALARPTSRRGRRRHRADAQTIVGTVPANGSSSLCVPVPGCFRRCRLVAVAGHVNGRSRVVTVQVVDRFRL